MKKIQIKFLMGAIVCGLSSGWALAQSAKVTESVNDVDHYSKSGAKSPAPAGTAVRDGESVETGTKSRAALELPTTSVTRLGSSTIFNYSASSNTIDLQQGTILFCKPKDAARLNITTAGISAGITGTTGFVSIVPGHQKTYIFGLVEGTARAHGPDGKPFALGPGDILEFKVGANPFKFSFDLPRFVKSSPLLHKYKGTLPNQSYIDRALAEYADDVSRGFIVPPSKAIDYSGDIPVLSTVAYSSAQNANQPRGSSAPPPPPSSTGYPFSPSSTH